MVLIMIKYDNCSYTEDLPNSIQSIYLEILK